MVMDTTDPGYWLNWRFVLCATWVYSCMALACYLIWKYEGPSSPAGNDEGVDREEAWPRIGLGVVYLDDCWKLCLDEIHPAWLLAFRLVSFLFMASVIIYDVIVDGWTVFLYYTQWTFLLVTLYFGLGSVLSVYGCYQYACKMDKSDADRGSYIIAPMEESTYDNSIKSSCLNKTHDGREIAGFWGYLFQIMFQFDVCTCDFFSLHEVSTWDESGMMDLAQSKMILGKGDLSLIMVNTWTIELPMSEYFKFASSL
ncbi:hypothetical protein D1007_01081 [Hordeum vulgare]|nr:hypothetical protein D1007_01081 [Hordeum vulgare]